MLVEGGLKQADSLDIFLTQLLGQWLKMSCQRRCRPFQSRTINRIFASHRTVEADQSILDKCLARASTDQARNSLLPPNDR